MAEDYDKLFAQLEQNVERLQADDVGMTARLALCRESRELVARCTEQLRRLGDEIEELRLDELLQDLDAVGGASHERRGEGSEEADDPGLDHRRGIAADTPSAAAARAFDTPWPDAADAPSIDDEEDDPPLVELVERHLRIVSATLTSVALPLTLSTLADFGRPPALAALLGQLGGERSAEAVEHVAVLQGNDAEMERALRRLAGLRTDRDAAEWFERGAREGRDVLAELARDLAAPAT
jgi:hypothetical protein